jgi:hypothetical protein
MTFHNMLYRQERNPQRHRLIRPQSGRVQTLAAGTPVFHDIKALREALQFAVSLEHFTIPPYLCALYSIQEESITGRNAAAARIIRSVAVEEMLHMILAANILNAIGGAPVIGPGEPIYKYPCKMPRIATDFDVNLLRFSKDAIKTFLRIERPAAPSEKPAKGEFPSIGAFYQSVLEALHRLHKEAKNKNPHGKGIFTGTQAQVTAEHYYGSGGKAFGVYNIEDAEDALDEIVGQGEGIDGSIEDGDGATFGDDVEYAHYYRFNEIFHGKRYTPQDKPGDEPSGAKLEVDWNAVYNMIPNPKMKKFTAQPGLHQKALEFNELYTRLLGNLHAACNGRPQVLREGIPIMRRMQIVAVELMKEPCGSGNYTAGPSFELVP